MLRSTLLATVAGGMLHAAQAATPPPKQVDAELLEFLGSLDVEDGSVDGDTLAWKMHLKVPMPMVLDCSATVEGDAITGSAGAGAFGSFPLSGTRV